MHWRTIVGLAALSGGCFGEPGVIDCVDDPGHRLCESGSTTDGPTGTGMGPETGTSPASSGGPTNPTEATIDPGEDTSSGGGEGMLPDHGICWREPAPLLATAGEPVTMIGNGRFELGFDRTENQMVTHLAAPEASANNLLNTGSPGGERLVGVQLYDQYFSYMQGDESPLFGMFEEGDALVRAAVDWSTINAGAGIESFNGGDSLHAVTPDGRMIRSEHLHVVQPPGSIHWLSATMSLVLSEFDEVRWFGADEGSYAFGQTPRFFFYPDEEPMTLANYGQVALCAYDSTTGVAVTFGGDPYHSSADSGAHPPPDPDSRPWGFRGAHNDDGSLGLQFDWVREGAPDETVYHTDLFAMISVFPDGDPCACAQAQFEAYVNPPTMDVEPGGLVDSVPVSQEYDGDQDGYFQQGGFYAIQPDANPVTVSVAERSIPSALLRFVGGNVGVVDVGTLIVRMDGVELTPGTDFLAQSTMDPGDGFWIWLARELPAEMELEVTWG